MEKLTFSKNNFVFKRVRISLSGFLIVLLANLHVILPNTASAVSYAVWTTQADFTNNASTSIVATTRNQVKITPQGNVRLIRRNTIAGGQEHSLVLLEDGSIKAWGNNWTYQLGNGTNTDALVPVQVSGINNAVENAGGDDHSLALLSDGSIKSWGYNAEGQLGNGSTKSSKEPIAVESVTNAISIATGSTSDHSLALLNNGSIKAWGDDSYGQLGNDEPKENSANAQNVIGVNNAIAVAVGMNHSLAVLQDGSVKAWGDDDNGQLGDGLPKQTSSKTVSVEAIDNAVSVAGGEDHSLALLSNGMVRAWGDDSNGQLGNGGPKKDSEMPVEVKDINNAIAIAAGNDFSMALLADGTIKTWGDNSSGQLGDGTLNDSLEPVIVSEIVDAVAISAGAKHALVTLSDNTVRSWGENAKGQLGNLERDNDYVKPVSVSNMNEAQLPFLTGTISNLKVNAGDNKKAKWDSIFWNSFEPADTTIKFRTRSADSEAGLVKAAWSRYYSSTGSNITSSDSQWLELEAVLKSEGPSSPVLDDVKVSYEVFELHKKNTVVSHKNKIKNKINSKLALKAVKKIKSGNSVFVKGMLRDSGGKPLADQVISVFVRVKKSIGKYKSKRKIYRRYKHVWVKLALAKTGSDGKFVIKHRPKVKKISYYRARFKGSEKYTKSVSRIVKIIAM